MMLLLNSCIHFLLYNHRLSGGSNIEVLEATLLRRRVEAIRDRLELMELDFALDRVRCEEVYESQQLKILLASTKPLERDEKKSDRNKKVSAMMQEATKAVTEAVSRSLSCHNVICDGAEQMGRNIDVFMIDQEKRSEIRIQHLNARFEKYISAIGDLVRVSEEKQRAVTEQYLVLRHNAKIAREILLESKNRGEREKEDLVARIQLIRDDVQNQLAKTEERFEQQLNDLIAKRRSEVLRGEEILEHDWADLEDTRKYLVSDSQNLKSALKEIKRKLKALLQRRERDLPKLEAELRVLRQATIGAEMSVIARRGGEGAKAYAARTLAARAKALKEEELRQFTLRLWNDGMVPR
jgi:gas vesicle protein